MYSGFPYPLEEVISRENAILISNTGVLSLPRHVERWLSEELAYVSDHLDVETEMNWP
jgi:hypothetical protein